jgi:hypothetical protein
VKHSKQLSCHTHPVSSHIPNMDEFVLSVLFVFVLFVLFVLVLVFACELFSEWVRVNA